MPVLPALNGFRPHANELLVYINGMQNPKDAHRVSAIALAGITRRDVFGVYNMMGTYANIYEGITPAFLWEEIIDYLENTPLGALDWTKPLVIPTLREYQRKGTFGTDSIQCVADWLYPFLTSPVVTTASAIADVADNAIDAFTSGLNTLSTAAGLGNVVRPTAADNAERLREAINALKGTFILVVLALNAGTMNFATGGMFNFLRSTHTVGKRIRIICHSQGTIITSNAVDAWSWFASTAVPPTAPPLQTTIYVLAGATPFWPPGVNLKFFTNSEDAIPLFSLGSSYDSNVLAVFNSGKRYAGVQHTVAPSGMKFNWNAAHNVDEYFTSAFANAIRADLGLPALTQDELDDIELDITNQMEALGINV
jgi:hypothetical protein